jgi:concentrative nucleoside transporter, CNT family
MAAPEYKEGHDASQNLRVGNPDPALEVSHEHHHEHLHHDAKITREESTVYTKGTTDEPHIIPHADPLDGVHKRNVNASYEKGEDVRVADTEKGNISSLEEEEDPREHKLSNLYAKYKVFVHLFIFLLFTGSVAHSLQILG